MVKINVSIFNIKKLRMFWYKSCPSQYIETVFVITVQWDYFCRSLAQHGTLRLFWCTSCRHCRLGLFWHMSCPTQNIETALVEVLPITVHWDLVITAQWDYFCRRLAQHSTLRLFGTRLAHHSILRLCWSSRYIETSQVVQCGTLPLFWWHWHWRQHFCPCDHSISTANRWRVVFCTPIRHK